MTEVQKKVEVFFSKHPSHKLSKGQLLIHAGDTPEFIYFLESGKVRQYDISFRGDEMVVNVFKPGAFFPMLPAMAKLPNKYFFEAETDVKVRLATWEETIDFLKANADVLMDLLTRVYIGLDGILGRMFQLMSGSARSRLLYELLIECLRFGKADEKDSLLVDINESDLAARTGLTRETVSREIQKIGKDGLIKINRQGIKIANLDKLKQQLSAELQGR